MRTISKPARRIPLATATAILMAAVAAVPADAHTTVSGTYPQAGRSVSPSASLVSVTFSGPIRRGTLRVTGPGGRLWSSGSGGRDPRNIRRLVARLRGGKPAGSYRATWSITAADGHRQRGSFSFRVRR
jgi:methionine-rich copper-binding protein CopC